MVRRPPMATPNHFKRAKMTAESAESAESAGAVLDSYLGVAAIKPSYVCRYHHPCLGAPLTNHHHEAPDCTFFSCVWPTGGPIVSLFFCVSMTGWASLCRVPHFSSLHSCELTSHCVIAAEASLIQWTVYWGNSDERSDSGRVRSAH